jgi:REP element-mobilizing transposase RayT
MPYVKNWLHCVWGTKVRTPYLAGDLKYDLLNHIRANAKGKDIYIDFINGSTEHLHCLLSLKYDHSLSYVMQMIKGESSHWINKNSLTKQKFLWAEEYYGVSVSESDIVNVREYIKNQERHHQKQSWLEETDEFIKIYGFEKFPG